MPISGVLDIFLLGPFRVVVRGVDVPDEQWGRRTAKVLVKLLALEPSHRLHREQVMDLLWPELDPDSALNNLHKTLHAARRALEPDLKAGAPSTYLITQEQEVLLRSPAGLWIDAVDFESLATQAVAGAGAAAFESALALYKGDLLAEDRYEDWASVRREKLRALHLELLLQLATLYEKDTRRQDAIRLLQQASEGDPCNENVARRLMRSHAAAGNRHLALQQFRRLRDALQRELEVEPEPATVRLHEQISAGEFLQAEVEAGTVASASAAATEAPPPRRISVRWWQAAAAGLAVAGALVTIFLVSRRQVVDSIAVLPLTSPEPGFEYVADGITEGVINHLSELPGLRVMARSTVFRFKGMNANPRAAGREIGVRAVLVGTVSPQGNAVSVSAELVDVGDGAQIWGRQFTFQPAELASAQVRISTSVAEALRMKLRPARNPTQNQQAYREYLMGRYYFNKRTDEFFRKGIEAFGRAAAIDPQYAAAYSGLADCYGLLAFGNEPPREYVARARSMVTKALQIDPDLAEAHTSLAMIKALYDWDWAGAEREFQRAIEINPGHATAHHWYGVHLGAMGRFDEARKTLSRALELDPLSPIIQLNSGYPDLYSRRFDDAVRTFRKTVELDPGFAWAHEDLMAALQVQGRPEDAVREGILALRLSGDTTLGGVVESALHRNGPREARREWLKQLLDRSARGYVSPIAIAQHHVALGEKEEAFRWLERAYQDRLAPLVYLKVDPQYDLLRSDPRFSELLLRIGLK